MTDVDPHGGGFMESSRRIASSVLGLLNNRLSLFAVELQEEKQRVISLFVWMCLVVTFGAAGIVAALGALALFLWHWAGYVGLIGLAAGSLVVASVMFLWVRRKVLRGAQPFATTVSEFGKDLECLKARH
jgi:uncharacterized membrane protein YqjE